MTDLTLNAKTETHSLQSLGTQTQEPQKTAKTVVALVIPSLCYGGAERQVVEIARHLDRSRFEVHIITLSDYTPLLPESDELRKSLHVIKKRGRFDFTVIWRLARELKRLNVEVAHAFLFYAEVATRLAARMVGVKPVIGSERNTDYKMAWYHWRSLHLTRNLVDAVIANSRAGARFHGNLYGLPDSRYQVVYNGVDIQRFRPRDKAACKISLGFDKETIVIGMFASFKRQKNHLQLFMAMENIAKKYPNAYLLLAGDTLMADYGDTLEYKRQVMEVMKECGIESITKILGNRTDVEMLYPACDFTVLPSFREGTPNVVLESLACGVPVVVTDISDNAHLVTDGEEGYVVPPNDVVALSSRLEAMCESAELRKTMARNARQTAEQRLSTQVMSANIASAYESIIAQCAGTRR